ncbi:hypothetical protein WR25_11208 [Diploscapter pachys]|uniref:ADP/ATP translocase n=1 Tax=Diploscapter pachys TaxID=2018661 RepID=A0A2A2LU19_9BILA|nr:hypothetical protein WR25_11208 [Diploscapter pachys]
MLVSLGNSEASVSKVPEVDAVGSLEIVEFTVQGRTLPSSFQEIHTRLIEKDTGTPTINLGATSLTSSEDSEAVTTSAGNGTAGLDLQILPPSTQMDVTSTVRRRDGGTKFMVDLLIGGTSASLSKTVVAPLERIKLLLQVQNSHRELLAQKPYNGILDAALRVSKEQGVSSFWRGNFTNVVRYFPTQALNFAFNDFYKSVFLKNVSRDTSFWKYTGLSLFSGGLAGSTSLCFVYPLDFVRTRLSVDIGKSKESRAYTGIVDCLVKTVKNEGFTGIYKGFPISIQTYFIYRAVYFGLYDTIRHFLVKDRRDMPFYGSFAIAQFVSIISGYITYPWDTVAKTIIKNEGIKVLYKGAVANILRTSGGALVMALYEEIQKHI